MERLYVSSPLSVAILSRALDKMVAGSGLGTKLRRKSRTHGLIVWRSPDPLTCLHFVDDVIGRQEEGLVDNSTLVVQPTLGGRASTSVIVTH